MLVNRVFASAGGCQVRLDAGDLALWVYDAFNGRPLLRLDGPAGLGEPTARAEGAPPEPVVSTFTVAPGQPLAVRAVATAGEVGLPGSETAAAQAGIAPVVTDARGIQTTGAPVATTDAAGRATLSWSTPGWKRIKAVADGHVRSNRLDVCVTPCTAAPPGGGVVKPPPSTVPEPRGGRPGSGSLVVGRGGRGDAARGRRPRHPAADHGRRQPDGPGQRALVARGREPAELGARVAAGRRALGPAGARAGTTVSPTARTVDAWRYRVQIPGRSASGPIPRWNAAHGYGSGPVAIPTLLTTP